MANIKHPRHEKALSGVKASNHIDRLDGVFEKQTLEMRDPWGLNKFMADRHSERPDPDAVEAVILWKSPRTDTQLISFLGFAN